MSIDLYAFTPWTALAGGALIGLAAAALLFINGRIAGISGIAGGLVNLLLPGAHARPGDTAWRLAFIAGLAGAPLAYSLFSPLPAVTVDAGWWTLIGAGLLVGIGTRYGAGCTSGHGVCGVARGSPRSIAATILFIIAGFITVYLVRHGLP